MKKKDKYGKIVEALLEDNEIASYADVSNILTDMKASMIQKLMDKELDIHVGYDKGSHDEKGTNRRNGYSSKGRKIKTDSGEITIDTPRDRDGTFEPKIIKKRQRVLDGIDDIVISMYAKGMSLSDIQEMIKKVYTINLSKQFLSSLTETVNEEVSKWQNRKLNKCYPFIYVDCLYCNVKKNVISEKVAIYVVLGINIEGVKEVLGIWIDKTESATFWNGIFEDLKTRGVEEILFVSMDGLKGLEESIENIYPKTNTQRCIVHLVRNLYNRASRKDAKEIIKDFKRIYTAKDKESAQEYYKVFLNKYKDKIRVIKFVKDNINHVLNLFDYPIEIRKIIYTTNPIESLNSALRKVTKGKGSFINETALMKVLYLRIKDLEEKWSKGTRGWNEVRNQLLILFKDRVEKYV